MCPRHRTRIFTFRSLFMQELQKSPPFADFVSAWERRSTFELLISSKRFIICAVKFVPTLLRIFGFLLSNCAIHYVEYYFAFE